MKKHFYYTALPLLLFCLFPPQSWAKELVVGIGNGYPPYYYRENGMLEGICVDIVNQVAKEMDLKLSYKLLPWKRMLASAKKGSVDAIMPLFRTEEREKFLLFNGLGLATEINYLFTSKEKNINYAGDISQLSPHTIGVVNNYSYGEEFDDFPGLQKIFTNSDQHLIEMFSHNRFDLGLGNKYVTLFYARKLKVENELVFLDPPVSQNLLYIGFSKHSKNSDMAVEFAQKLERFKTTTQYYDIINNYLKNE